MSGLDIYIDGASKGNPGPSGIGVVICKDKETIKNISNFIGEATNNVAEYTALIYALQEALVLKEAEVRINTDSELLYKQIIGEYKVKNMNMLMLYKQVEHLVGSFKKFSIKHIPRENNRGADKLANLAIKPQLKNRSLVRG